MQVARDALPFGDRGEPLDLLVRAAQATLGALSFGIEEVRGPRHDREDERRDQAEEAPRAGTGEMTSISARMPTSAAMTTTARRTGSMYAAEAAA